MSSIGNNRQSVSQTRRLRCLLRSLANSSTQAIRTLRLLPAEQSFSPAAATAWRFGQPDHAEFAGLTYAARYHKHYQSGGHVCQGRFKSPVVQNDEHLLTVLRYIEANPLRAKIVTRAEEYAWSSYRVHGLVKRTIGGLIAYLRGAVSHYPAVRQRRCRDGSSAVRGSGVDGDSSLE